MIEFEGKLSNDCKKYTINKVRKFVGTISSIITTMFMLALVVFSFVIGSRFLILFSIIFGMIMILLFPIAIAFATTAEKDQYDFFPIKIYIDVEDGTIGAISKNLKNEHAISSVKQIIDFGEWYDVKLFFGGEKNVETVIQKDLITKGTIAEFENLFSDKIVPAKKKN